MKKLMLLLLVGILGLCPFCSGCSSKAGTGAGIGALIGGGIGQLAGGDTKSTVIGAAVGAGAGYLIGKHEENKEVKDNPDDFVKVPFANSDGTTTTVALRKADGGYIGPKGERYNSIPTAEELKEKYGY